MQNKNKKIVGLLVMVPSLFFLIFGVVLTILGFVFGAVFNDVDTQYMTKEVTGITTKIDSNDNNHDDNSGKAVVEYEVAGVKYEASTGYESSTFKVGKRMEVMYDPTRPEYSAVKTPEILIKVIIGMKIGGIVCLGLCAVSIFTGLFIIFKARKEKVDNGVEPWEMK